MKKSSSVSFWWNEATEVIEATEAVKVIKAAEVFEARQKLNVISDWGLRVSESKEKIAKFWKKIIFEPDVDLHMKTGSNNQNVHVSGFWNYLQIKCNLYIYIRDAAG